MIKSSFNLRYYARFIGDYGRLRAVIRRNGIRKFITTPVLISRQQFENLCSSGEVVTLITSEDFSLQERLNEVTALIREVVTPLIESGSFDSTRSALITRALFMADQARATKGKGVSDEH